MYKIERQEKILEYVNKEGRASIAELSDLFQVSKVTIRADIDELEVKNLVCKTHGGVLSKEIGIASEIPYEVKNQGNIKEKQRIAKEALKYIDKNDVIILDSGTTTYQLVDGLPEDITVITTDILIAVGIIQSKKNIRVLMPGGEIEKSVYTMEGIDAIRYFENIHADKLFLACDAVDFDFGVSDRSHQYAITKQTMIEAASQVILVTDSSKFYSKLVRKVCTLDKLDVVIVDKIEDSMRKKCEEANVSVVVAK